MQRHWSTAVLQFPCYSYLHFIDQQRPQVPLLSTIPQTCTLLPHPALKFPHTYKIPRPSHLLECFEHTPLVWPCLSHHPKVSHQARLMTLQQQLVLGEENHHEKIGIFQKLMNTLANWFYESNLSNFTSKNLVTLLWQASGTKVHFWSTAAVYIPTFNMQIHYVYTDLSRWQCLLHRKSFSEHLRRSLMLCNSLFSTDGILQLLQFWTVPDQ